LQGNFSADSIKIPATTGDAVGYYSRIDFFDVRIRPEKAAEVAAAIASARRGEDHPFGVAELLLEGGELWWDWDYGTSDVQKWRPDEPLIPLLSGWCERGWVAFWSCEGDGGQWAYELDGKGGYAECSARRVSALRAAETRRWSRRELERERHQVDHP
jgi:hypothetical protein